MDLYVILGLQHGATESDIRRAYRRLARRFHPDINPGDRTAEARFRQILEAYETLTDPNRRLRYEAGHGVEPAEERPTSGFEGFDFSARGSDHSVTFGDLFAEVLHQRGTLATAPARGADLHQDIQVSFADAFAGVVRTVALTRRQSCGTCAGTGVMRGDGVPCLVCQGAGRVQSIRGHMVFSRGCAACKGTGQQGPRGCASCGRTGERVSADALSVPIPAGAAEGDRLRMAGMGNAGLRGGPPGDLHLTVHVLPDGVFRREGDDVHVRVGVAIHEAALGARIDVPAPDGMARLRIPAGTQSGQHLRVRERGMVTRDGRRGDLIVEVQLRLPGVLDESSKALLREFGRINAQNVRDVGPPAVSPELGDSGSGEP